MSGCVPVEREVVDRYGRLARGTGSLACGRALDHAGVTPGEVCIDLGCGRGDTVRALGALTGPRGLVIGVDRSAAMIAAARENAGEGPIRFVEGSIANLGLAGGIGDLVISNCTLNHSADQEAAWAEIFRILKPGGRFVVSDIYATAAIPRELAGDPRLVAQCWAGALTRDGVIRCMEAAGFVDIAFIDESDPYHRHGVTLRSYTATGHRPVDTTSKPSRGDIP